MNKISSVIEVKTINDLPKNAEIGDIAYVRQPPYFIYFWNGKDWLRIVENPLLTEEEKQFLKCFEFAYFTKYSGFICFEFADGTADFIHIDLERIPNLEFKGLKVDKSYSKEELSL